MRLGQGTVGAAASLLLLGSPPLLAQGSAEPTVRVLEDGPAGLRIVTSAAEFAVSSSGAVTPSLSRNAERLTIEDAPSGRASAEGLVVRGAGTSGLVVDWGKPRVTAARGLGSRGKRVEWTGRNPTGLEVAVGLEAYEAFPGLALRTITVRNAGAKTVRLDRIETERHRLRPSPAASASRPALWSFHGAAADWGKDEVVPVSPGLRRPNVFGAPLPNGVGGGIPVVAFWSASVGEAVGHLEPGPRVLSIPVAAEPDGDVSAAVVLEPRVSLSPGSVYQAPRTFVAVFAGDYYDALRLYSTALQAQGWRLPEPTAESFAPSWCGWGYEADVTPEQMRGIVPKLRALGIPRATLDYRWFSRYGSWEARSDTWPGGAVRDLVAEYHRQGIKVQLWWMPLAVEAGRSPLPSPEGSGPGIAAEHPEWLIRDERGRPARMTFSVTPKEPLYVLCPALPEVQEHYRRIAARFIGDWGFDGHKLDYSYSVPRCYDPRHGHASPEDSIAAMGEVYRAIFETTRALKPDAVTQICPCGTPPNLAWLPAMDQAVTADPVGSVQVRRRIKMYKALLGPEAAVYGDHVELTEVRQERGREIDAGSDFASTVGAGGIPGTKFVLPDADPQFRSLFLTPERESAWRKWMGIYNDRLLSKGTFLNLYVYGFDAPEAYAIRKDGALYYAFFAPAGAGGWDGEVELRGLEARAYRVRDYVNDADLGAVDGRRPRLRVSFARDLLLEARPE